MAERIAGARLERVLGDVEEQVRGAPVPAIPWARIEERAATRARARRKRNGLLGGAAAVAVLLAGAAAWRLAPAPAPAGFRIAAATQEFRYHVEDGRVLVAESGRATLSVKELATRIELDGAARLRREAGGVRVEGGAALFEVEPRRNAALVVYVSGGRIEVLGTRFTVRQGEGAGEVVLERGAVLFVAADGTRTALRPGERLRWPPPPPPPAPPAPAPPPSAPEVAPPPRNPPPRPRPGLETRAPAPQVGPAPSPPPPPEPSEVVARERRVLAEIDRMRLRLEDEALAGRLNELLAEDLQEPLRERVSFERCDLLAHRAGAERDTCRAIDEHLSRYPAGEYTARLQRTRRKLGCEP